MVVLKGSEISLDDLLGYSKLKELLALILAALEEQGGNIAEWNNSKDSFLHQLQALTARLESQEASVATLQASTGQIDSLASRLDKQEDLSGQFQTALTQLGHQQQATSEQCAALDAALHELQEQMPSREELKKDWQTALASVSEALDKLRLDQTSLEATLDERIPKGLALDSLPDWQRSLSELSDAVTTLQRGQSSLEERIPTDMQSDSSPDWQGPLAELSEAVTMLQRSQESLEKQLLQLQRTDAFGGRLKEAQQNASSRSLTEQELSCRSRLDVDSEPSTVMPLQLEEEVKHLSKQMETLSSAVKRLENARQANSNSAASMSEKQLIMENNKLTPNHIDETYLNTRLEEIWESIHRIEANQRVKHQGSDASGEEKGVTTSATQSNGQMDIRLRKLEADLAACLAQQKHGQKVADLESKMGGLLEKLRAMQEQRSQDIVDLEGKIRNGFEQVQADSKPNDILFKKLEQGLGTLQDTMQNQVKPRLRSMSEKQAGDVQCLAKAHADLVNLVKAKAGATAKCLCCFDTKSQSTRPKGILGSDGRSYMNEAHAGGNWPHEKWPPDDNAVSWADREQKVRPALQGGSGAPLRKRRIQSASAGSLEARRALQTLQGRALHSGALPANQNQAESATLPQAHDSAS